MRGCSIVILAVFFLSACTKPVSIPSFYYWKTTFALSAKEQQTLQELQVQDLYLRFFDVDVSRQGQKAIPLGILRQDMPFPDGLTIIPVVFITNRTFLALGDQEAEELAAQLVGRLNRMKRDYREVQIDCDWSLQTKSRYFLFLRKLKEHVGDSVSLSATIRLHQVKYHKITGIPPVNKGVLMFYNMGDLSDNGEKNSIYNARNAEKYTAYLRSYPLPLDAALPVFSWFVHYRDGRMQGLVTKKQLPDLRDSLHFLKRPKNTTFMAGSSFFENGVYYKKGDVLKPEALSAEELKDAARLLHKSLKTENRRLIFYDLDEINIDHYDKAVFKEVMAIFN